MTPSFAQYALLLAPTSSPTPAAPQTVPPPRTATRVKGRVGTSASDLKVRNVFERQGVTGGRAAVDFEALELYNEMLEKRRTRRHKACRMTGRRRRWTR